MVVFVPVALVQIISALSALPRYRLPAYKVVAVALVVLKLREVSPPVTERLVPEELVKVVVTKDEVAEAVKVVTFVPAKLVVPEAERFKRANVEPVALLKLKAPLIVEVVRVRFVPEPVVKAKFWAKIVPVALMLVIPRVEPVALVKKVVWREAVVVTVRYPVPR